MQCQLCERDCNQTTIHHLVPRQYTKRKKLDPGETIDICSACHRQIHSLFANRLLATELNTLEKLKQQPDMVRFLTWIRKQDTNKRVKVR
ncbi:HNH endonuclease [Leptolyngbya sp. NK1-12]|uniref:HNH endonuclease n=1 Tax=Leptolyngbya sp. NK1-12 TaxID=2547451 RepID=UPI003B637295